MNVSENLKTRADIMLCIFYPCAPHIEWRGQRAKPEVSVLSHRTSGGTKEKGRGYRTPGSNSLVGAVTMVRQTGRS